MIRRLKVKFVALATISVFALLCLIVAGMNLINYREVVREADEILSFLSQNRGTFPIFGEGKEDRLPHGMSPELPYESRFFSVLLTDSGEVIHTETSRIKQVDTEAAIQYAQKALTDKNELGFVDNYRFMRNVEGDTIRITFLDRGQRLDAFQYFLFASCLMALVGFVAGFFVILLFSGRIIRPAAESYDKQKRFITDAGHELKTPLTIIKADVDILAMELGKNEWLEDIQKQTDRLSALTGELVYLSRMEEAESAMAMIVFPFSEVVSETAASFQALAQTQNKPFECRIQPMLSMNGNEEAIRQLVGILQHRQNRGTGLTFEEFYGASYGAMRHAERQLVRLAETYPHPDEEDMNPVIYCRSRLKTPESMVHKLRMRGLPEDGQTALSEVYDAVGVRIVCAFIEDVYSIVQWLRDCAELEVMQEKDYLAFPKENGYRSYHLLVKIIDGEGAGVPAEIQVRTIATDCWATLEHRLKYKKDIGHAELMYSELKRCADEIASVDLSMQTLLEFVRADVV